MKAVRLHHYGEMPLLEEVAEPGITSQYDVIVRVGGAGLCRTDLHIMEGNFKESSGVSLPYILGHENAGWVHEIGSAVSNVAVGDTVIVHPQMSCGFCRACRAGNDMHCSRAEFSGMSVDGGMAQLLKTSARAVVKLEPTFAPQDIAALADAGLTAYHAIKKAVPQLYPGAKVVVIGAGGLGHIGIQCLKALTPAEIIVVDRVPEALELAKGWGADYTVYTSGNQVAKVKEITAGQGAEAIIDFVGEGSALADGVAMLRRAGNYYMVGYGGKLQVPTSDMIATEINFIGNLVGTYNDLVELMTLTAQGKVKLHTTFYPLAAAREAFQDLASGNLRGRGILIPEWP
ncbi:NAD(P)-dependent alcohol dehydrogenase [Ktedonosporobacter rubrisoli]|uniref:alcohol dehydrogenase n=1 Tax=Ktedonosporobacter rubrisoli TaxID=2509675 RepID=A0A4P6JNN6_KTERU|nr:NAD(P)-dependent alcohol dehydrogenase [Ktedonosporobacter rubrisoli]QBD76682.1 NAD(P)-dependent alcohol dehydrogenase [Ktedonosporobacter rubrisoli]